MNGRHDISRRAGALGLIALLGAGLLAGTWALTRERIAAQEKQAEMQTLHQIIPAEAYDNDMHDDRFEVHAPARFKHPAPVVVWRARREGEPVGAILRVVAPGGYNGDIVLLVGVAPEGDVLGVRVLSHRETPGLGDPIERSKSDWILSFNGRSLGDPPAADWTVKRAGGAFDQFTGATITPRAVVHAVRRTLDWFAAHRELVFEHPAETGEAGQ